MALRHAWYAGALVWIVLSSSARACDRDAFTIAIDPGHTARNPGAESARGTPEWRFNQELAALLVGELRANGFHDVFLTNDNGSEITLEERADRANRLNAKLFLSIHHDSVQARYLSYWNYQGKRRAYSDLFSGYSLFFSKKNVDAKRSLAFARFVGSEFRNSCLTPTLHHSEPIPGEGRNLIDKERGIYEFDDLVVLKATKMPAVLIEAGLIVNRTDEIDLRKPAHQKMMADSIVRAVSRFCDDASGNDVEFPGTATQTADPDPRCRTR